MSKPGIGRGRGWLNLKSQNNASNTNRVGNNVPVSCQDSCENEFTDAKNDYNDIINKVKQLNMNDDGILFNQKVKYILENWNEDCQTPEQVE